MYLASLTIKNFRRLENVTLRFEPGLNVLVGPNNVGKTAVVDALRALLAGADDPYPRFDREDIYKPKGGAASGEIAFGYKFRSLSLEDEADFLHALKPDADGNTEAILGVRYGNMDKSVRLSARRWCGDHDDVLMSPGMLENLRSVYLPPLRDAAQGLKPSRTSQLSRLLHLLSDDAGRDGITAALKELDDKIKAHQPIVDTQTAISVRHEAMLGSHLTQLLQIGLSATDFQKLAARLSLLVDSFEIESNGLGYNNLIYMAVVLSELAKNADSAFRSLIVEEPEAHLHPQLQAILLRYLSDIECKEGERPVQVFVTSHSPNFASIAALSSIACLVDCGPTVKAFHPRDVKFTKGKREKLERYLDVTRAQLFFARRVIFVEGAAEMMMVNLLAQKSGVDLRDHGVSLISVEGLNFDCFTPLYGSDGIDIPASIITDADPQKEDGPDSISTAQYPPLGAAVTPSANASALKAHENGLLKVFFGVKTFEYDFALHEKNRTAMLLALKDIHPRIGEKLETEVAAEADNAAKARILFKGMFERSENNVQKGRFAQALAARIVDDNLEIVVPDYISDAIKHVTTA